MRAVLRWLAIGAGVVLVVAAGVGWATYRKLSGNIKTDSAAERVLSQYASQRPRALVPQARNILVLGAGEPRESTEDAAVLLHLSADRHRAAAVAVPGDLRLRAPGCPVPAAGARADGGARDGGASASGQPDGGARDGGASASGQLDGGARDGGAACAIRGFERLSGIRVDHHLVVDRAGFERIASAVGGRSMDGRSAGVLRALAAEAHAGGGSLAHPARLYGLLNAATSSITADPGLSSLPALYELAGSLRALPHDGLVVRTVPVGGRGGPREPYADRLFAALREDLPLTGVPETS